jgi:hypothetical protein
MSADGRISAHRGGLPKRPWGERWQACHTALDELQVPDVTGSARPRRGLAPAVNLLGTEAWASAPIELAEVEAIPMSSPRISWPIAPLPRGSTPRKK